MKNLVESAEVFEAYATIDCCYYMIQDIYQQLGQKRTGIEAMIDNATGYKAAKIKEQRESIIELLETIIYKKKFIEADFSQDEAALSEIKKLAHDHNSNNPNS